MPSRLLYFNSLLGLWAVSFDEGSSIQDIGWIYLWPIVLRAILVGGIAFAIGLVPLLLLWKKRWFDAPWSWYRYLKWLWVPLVLLPMIAGGLLIGAASGMRYSAAVAIDKDRVVRRAFAEIHLATAQEEGLDLPARNLGLDATLDKIDESEALVGTTFEQLREDTVEDLKRQVDAHTEDGWLSRMIAKWIIDDQIGEVEIGDIKDLEAKTIIKVGLIFAYDPARTERLSEDDTLVFGIVGKVLSRMEEGVLGMVAALATSLMLTGLAIALLVPLVPLLFLRFVIRLTGGSSRSEEKGKELVNSE